MTNCFECVCKTINYLVIIWFGSYFKTIDSASAFKPSLRTRGSKTKVCHRMNWSLAERSGTRFYSRSVSSPPKFGFVREEWKIQLKSISLRKTKWQGRYSSFQCEFSSLLKRTWLAETSIHPYLLYHRHRSFIVRSPFNGVICCRERAVGSLHNMRWLWWWVPTGAEMARK